MSFEIAGKVVKIFDIESKTDSFQARDFVIESVDDRYPQMIKFQLTQDRCSIVDAYKEGDELKVYFDLRGREWNGKYFTNLNAWKVESISSNQAAAIPESPVNQTDFPTEDPFANVSQPETQTGNLDDLPF